MRLERKNLERKTDENVHECNADAYLTKCTETRYVPSARI